MLKTIPSLALACVCCFSLHLAMAQQPQAPAQQAAAAVAEPEAPRVVLQAEATTSVLRLMKFSGALRDRTGNARTGAVGLTFALYKEQQGGAPLWLEVHNALLDEQGRYTVLLGSIKSDGLPLELFSTGEARWLGVQLNLPGEEEQPRVLLVSVPYALKAADAEMLGGKPPSAFLLAEKAEGGKATEVKPEAGKEEVKEGPRSEGVTGAPIKGEGTTGTVAKFTGANTIGDGSIFDNGFVGVGNTNPFGKLTVTHPLSGAVSKALLLESHYDLNSGTKIVFDSLSNNGERASIGYSIVSGGGGELFFNASPQGGFPVSERMRITNTGNVGIGTATPGQKLTVAGTIESTSGGFKFPDGTTQTTAVPGGRPRINSLQVATLRWYEANQTGLNFPVGNGPEGIAFDGINIWVANLFSNTVTKLRASDGANLGTFAVGVRPIHVAFDGANIWVANSGSNSVTKLRASDGANLGDPAVGLGAPRGIAFDGANIWVANSGSNSAIKLRASDGANLGSFLVGRGPEGVAFDGTSIWVTNFSDNTVTKLRASDGTNLGTFAVSTGPLGIAFDGENIWVVNQISSRLTKLRASDGANLGTFFAGSSPRHLAFDGTNVWVSNAGSNSVTKLRASDGASLGNFVVGTEPHGVAFDGANIWVTNWNGGTVSKL